MVKDIIVTSHSLTAFTGTTTENFHKPYMTAKLTILAVATKQEKILNQVGEEVKKLVNKVQKDIFH
jgi:hypothetical protein